MDRVAIPVAMLDLLDEAWAIRPSVLRTFLGWVNEGSIPATALAERTEQRPRAAGGTMTIAVRGPITRRPTVLSFLCGGASTEQIAAALHEGLADPEVNRIVLDIDSPGGSVDGVPELAAEIHAARAKKPITAMVDTVAASAAYWLASQANEIIVAPSGQVGSIGVFGLHLDRSRQLEAEGITPTFIHAGKYKVEENPLQPLSDEAKASIQERIDAFYSMFIRDVAKGRGVTVEQVRKDYGEGRMVLAKDAVAKGMADRVSDRAPSGSGLRAEADSQLIWAVAQANASRIQRSLAGVS